MKKVIIGVAVLLIIGLLYLFTKSGAIKVNINTYKFGELSNLAVCADPDSRKVCFSHESQIPQSTGVLYTSANYVNAKVGSSVIITWTYKDDNYEIDSGPVTVGQEGTEYINGELTNHAKWPLGIYEVKMYVEGDEENQVSVEFEII